MSDIPIYHIGGAEVETKEKPRKQFTIKHGKEVFYSTLAVLINNPDLKGYFGDKNIAALRDYAHKHQNSNPKYKSFLLLSNKVQRNCFDYESGTIELDQFETILGKDARKFESTEELLKVFARGFNKISEAVEEGEDDDEEEGQNEEEEEEEDSSDSDDSDNSQSKTKKGKKGASGPVGSFQEIVELSQKIRDALKEIQPSKLAKFLHLKVPHNSPIYQIIESMRYFLSVSTDTQIELIKFKNEELLKLYMGLPFYSLKNEKRIQYIEWFKQQTCFLDEEPEEGDSEAMKVARLLSQYFRFLNESFKIIQNADLDQRKEKTYDKECKEIRTFESDRLTWIYAPMSEEFTVTLVKMSDHCQLGTSTYGVIIVNGERLFEFPNMQLSSFSDSQSMTYFDIRQRLSEFMKIPNSNYLVARTSSSKSAVYQTEDAFLNGDFINSSINYYDLSTEDTDLIKKRIKGLLFIRITQTYLMLLALELSKPLNTQIDIIIEKFKAHNLSFTKEELRQKLTWNDGTIDWGKEFSFFQEENDDSSLGKTAPLFTFKGTATEKPVYNTEIHDNQVNLKMKTGEIMIHSYRDSYEAYRKQQFELEIMEPNLLGFDIGQYSSKFDFCSKFVFDSKKVNFKQETSDTISHYIPFALLLKRPRTKCRSVLFFYDQESHNFYSAQEPESTMGFEDMETAFVKMAWYIKDKNYGEEPGMEVIKS